MPANEYISEALRLSGYPGVSADVFKIMKASNLPWTEAILAHARTLEKIKPKGD